MYDNPGQEHKVTLPHIITFSEEGKETLIGIVTGTRETQYGLNYRLREATFQVEGCEPVEYPVCIVGMYVTLQPMLECVPIGKVVKIVCTGERKSTTSARAVRVFDVSYFD